jgi:AbrB family looped-hinge helix DNA binding protein
MKITIDRAGRVVLPKSVRDRFHLVAGTELELQTDEEGVNLRVMNRGGSLIESGGILVHHGAEVVPVDVAEFIRREREARALQAAPTPQPL